MDYLPTHPLFVSVTLAIFLATGCSASKPVLKPPVNPGFTVHLAEQYDTLPNYTRIHFQEGLRVTEKALDKWTTYCSLYVYNRDKKADYLSSIKPGIFNILSVNNRIVSSRDPFEYSEGLYQSSNLYASAGISFGLGLDWERDGPPSYYIYKVEMKLASADQPDLKSLTCSKKWATRGNYFPTLIEIRRALGVLVKIEPNSV